jgi:hypothetical protein
VSIKIAARLRPFSHTPGATCPIPRSLWCVSVYPALLRFFHPLEEGVEVSLDIRGPVREFTVELDLEDGLVRVFGRTPDGFMRYLLLREGDRIAWRQEKWPSRCVPKVCLSERAAWVEGPAERLSLGMHKALQWEQVCARQDLREILPVWLRLSGWLPSVPPGPRVGTLRLLDACAHTSKTEIAESLLALFNVGFYGLGAPRLLDTQHQGLAPLEAIPDGLFPHLLIHEGAACIRALFFRECAEGLSLLPCLPPAFHSGRFTGVRYAGGAVDMEWSKKLLRRTSWHPKTAHDVPLLLQRAFTSFRARSSLREKSSTHSCPATLRLEAARPLFLDRFQK